MNKDNSDLKLDFKNAIFNKFYLEFIVFFIILFISTIINLVITLKFETQLMPIILSFITLIVTILSLYSFGYIVAQKRKLLNKYFPSVFFAFIFIVIWILATVLKNEESFISKLICNSDKMILMIHSYIFNLVNIIFNIKIPTRIFCFVTPLIVYLGNAKSRRRELAKIKKQKINNTKEENDGYTNI